MEQTIGSIGWAIQRMKEGAKVARVGWNGKGMYILIMDGYASVPANAMTREKHKLVEGDKVSIAPYIVMRTATGILQPGWLASQPDLLSEDWEEVTDVS